MAQTSGGVTINVISSNGMHGALAELGPQFERASGHKLAIIFDTGTGFNERIARGERADVAIITVPIIENMARAGISGPPCALARSSVGVGVRAGAPKPDIRTVDALKRAVLAVKSITYTGQGASGMHFAKLIDRLGIAAEITAKATIPDGGLVGEIVAAGKVEMAIQQLPELIAVKGVDVVGPFPAEVQLYSNVAAAVFANSPHAAAAKALVEFLASPAALKVYRGMGMETA